MGDLEDKLTEIGVFDVKWPKGDRILEDSARYFTFIAVGDFEETSGQKRTCNRRKMNAFTIMCESIEQ